MATVLRFKLFSALRNASRNCSFLKTKSPANVRSLATALQENKENLLKKYQQMSVHQCLLLLENKINTKGRLSGYELDCIFQATQNRGSLQSNQVLLLIRCCGSIATNEKPEERMVYAEKIWNSVKISGVELDITHYNAYLKVQMENEQQISPSEFLKTLENEGLVPNRVTYQYLLTHCCVNGDLVGATELLEKMKSKNYPLNENVFNALVMGYSIVNDIKGAEGIMNIMKEKDIFITSNTYSMFLCGLAISGNIEKMRSVMEECSKQNIEIRGSRLMDVVYYLFINGHYDYAEELLKGLGEIQNFGEVLVLQFRLLHKKNYEGYLRTLPLISNSEDMVNRMRLAFRYLGNKEDFASILEFKKLCDEKGLDVDPMRNILYYSLMSDNRDSLRIIEHLHNSGQQIKEIYFAPLLIKASENGYLGEVVHIVNTMCYRYSIELSSEFLTCKIFDHVKCNDKQKGFLLGSLTLQIPSAVVFNAFIKSALKRGDEESLRFMVNKYRIPIKIPEHLFGSMVNYLKDGYNLKILIDLLEKWISQEKSYINQKNLSETEKSQTEGDNRKDFQGAIDKLAIKIFRHCERSITEEFLNVAEQKNFPISTKVVDLIRQKLNDASVEFPEGELGEEMADDTEISKLEQTSGAEDTALSLFNKYKKTGNITEMEKIFNENESLQTYFGFKKMVESLKSLNEEDLVKQYLRRYYEKFSQTDFLPRNLFLEAEMCNRGMLKEAVELIDKRISSTRVRSYRFVITEMFIPLFERGDQNQIKELLSLKSTTGTYIIHLEALIENLTNRNLEALAVKILPLLDAADLSSVDIQKQLIPSLFNKEKFELMEEVTKFVENNPYFNNSGSALMFLYACSGKIAKGRQMIGNLPDPQRMVPLQWMKNLSAINSPGRVQVVENAVAMLRGNNWNQKARMYEYLMVNYDLESVNPEKALDLWLELQEEDVQPTSKFLNTLAAILKRNGREVPFQPPGYTDIPKTIYMPQSFPWDIKKAVWSIRGRQGFNNGIEKLSLLLLQNKLNANHISTIFNLNKDLDKEVIKVLHKISSFIELKKEYENGTLADYLQKFVDGSDGKPPEEKIKEIPFNFLTPLFDIFPAEERQSHPVQEIILWAYWGQIPEYSRFAELLKPHVHELIKFEEVVEALVETLEVKSFDQKHKKITSFLLSQKVFDEYESFKKRVEHVLNWTGDATPLVSESSSDDDFSFRNAFQDQTEGKTTEKQIDSEKSVEKLESSDIAEAEKRKSGAGPNL